MANSEIPRAKVDGRPRLTKPATAPTCEDVRLCRFSGHGTKSSSGTLPGDEKPGRDNKRLGFPVPGFCHEAARSVGFDATLIGRFGGRGTQPRLKSWSTKACRTVQV